MDFDESQLSLVDPSDIERLKKAFGLPLKATSICLATLKEGEQCGTTISHKEKLDPILASLILELSPTALPPMPSRSVFISNTNWLLLQLTFDSRCPSWSQHEAPLENVLSVFTLCDLFHKWKQSEENGRTNPEASTAGIDGYQESQTSALGEEFQRKTAHEAAFDSDEYSENNEEGDDEYEEKDEEDEYDDDEEEEEDDGDENDTRSHSEYQPSELQSDEDGEDKGRTNDDLDGKPAEVPKNGSWELPDEKLRHDRETILHATDNQAPTALTASITPPRKTNNSSTSEPGSKDEPGSLSEASTPVPPIFSPSEPSLTDTPDTEKTASSTCWGDSDGYSGSPSLNRGSSARSGKGLSFPPPAMPSPLQPKTHESHNEERPTTPSNSKIQGSARKNTKQRERSVSTERASARILLHRSRTLLDGTKTANIYKNSTKLNALKETLFTMRSIPYGDRGIPGHVYAYTHKSVPGHIKIGYAKDEGGSFKKSHIVLHRVDQHKDLHLWNRLQDQEDSCMSGMKVLFAVYMPCAAGHIERLVHRTLYEEKRIAECQKVGCGKNHIEWFDVEEERAYEVITRWAEFSQLLPYSEKGSLGESWDNHAYEHYKKSSSMTFKEWWDDSWIKFRTTQEIEHDQQLAAALEEKRSSQQEEMSLLDAQLEIQLERNRLQQEKNELEQRATRLREEKVERDLERARDRQQELQQQINKLSLR